MQRSSIYSSSIPRDYNTLESIFGHSDNEDNEAAASISSHRNGTDDDHLALPNRQSSIHSYSDTASRRQSFLDIQKPPQLHAPIPVDYDSDSKDSSTIMTELRIISIYLVPIYLTHLLEYSLNVASVLSVGHIDKMALAAMSLSSMTAAVTGFALIQGFATGLDSLLATSYASSNPQLCGTWTVRMGIVLSILIVPIGTVWFNAERILLSIGQDAEVAHLAGTYLRYYIASLPGFAGFELLRKFLQSCGNMHVPTIVLIIISPLNMLLQYLLVWRTSLGFIGSPIASAICIDLIALMLLLYIVFTPKVRHDTWGGFSYLVFRDLDVCFKLGASAATMTLSEWFAWEGLAFAASFISPTALAAQSVINTSSSISYQLPSALSVASSVRIGTLMGKYLPNRASAATKATVNLSFGIAFCNALIFLTFRNSFAKIFTSDADVIELVAKILPLVAMFQFTDGTISSCLGILRTTGRQLTGAVIQITGFYIIGLPLAICMAFLPKINPIAHWPWPNAQSDRLIGLWLGMSIALGLNVIAVLWIVSRINWDKECKLADIRVKGTTSVEHTVDETTTPNERQPLLANNHV
ncbi:multidrug/Oligosaccharidyl-lipid/Polysaccharide flippase [Wallemia mellicola]|uniref:Multidrug/Oligosaccharidyl-lipid/Polysaccharide flippase n=1 Tax=Wallemia mellicola TaxID=1708541 RepID=A0A4T0LYC4_9BASI|nr:hypothetical protein E3Q24_00103 [Wallemia mellicola]TIB84927.1 multidrug/Oligosaccharidyl-lipid/Polysaccharide flippase [Wallemia mellicola]TIB88145.1 multidrug/Oligosaccharidyl-lipid/Polysaccharide flippase [Wallemia mellicola]TIC00109.1 multidrug/Oligosaccharidyl-lipid/Polysaccharide flippase [Wallemia mellicola]TIC06537.1 multidrug/Oligosaccharidyl-lipid/Polysaccharide flippase [Wallemia mellicola]